MKARRVVIKLGTSTLTGGSAGLSRARMLEIVRPVHALLTALMQCGLALCLAIVTASGSIGHFSPTLHTPAPDYDVLQQIAFDPSTWIIIVGWVFAAFAMALLCSRLSSVSAVIGTILATVIMLVAQVLAQWLKLGYPAFPSIGWTIAIVIAAVLMVVVSVVHAPHRREEE